MYKFLCLPTYKQTEIIAGLELGIEAGGMNDYPEVFRRIRQQEKMGRLQTAVESAARELKP